MIDSKPRWTFRARHTLTKMYGHVQLLPGHALGQWCCVDRETGTPLWERAYDPPNCVFGVADGVVVASETVSSGPGTGNQGCYGISLATGDIAWASHGDDGTDAPSVVRGGEVLCRRGRVLAVRDGREVRRVSVDEVKAGERARFADPGSDAMRLYRARNGGSFGGGPVQVGDAGWLTHGRTRDERGPREGFRLYLVDDADRVAWSFDLATTGYLINHCNYYAYRLVGRQVYVVAAEGPNRREAPPPVYSEPIPTTFHLLAVELERGTIAHDVRLNDEPVADCRIEDVDERAVLVSTGGRELKYYGRVAETAR